MESYKDKKFRAHKELECAFYALENEHDAHRKQDEQEHQDKIDDINSKVSFEYQ